MKNAVKSIFFIYIFLVFAKSINAQTGIWLKIGAEKSISKKLELDINAQARYNELKGPASSYLVDAGLKYDFNKKIWAGLYYRYISDLKKNGYKPLHRFYGDFGYKFRKLNPIAIDYRLRYQQQFKDEDTGLVADKNYLRNKIELSYKNKSKFEPSFSADLFYRIGSNLDQVRYKAAIEYNFSKKQSIEIGYQIDDEINSLKSSRNRITASYEFKF